LSEDGYSTIMDAILFLALVAVSAAIMSPAITGHATEQSMADRSLRELSASTLISLESEKVDFFEYRVLGDVADTIAGAGGINATSDILYRDVTKAILGRGNRHRTVMDIAAGNNQAHIDKTYPVLIEENLGNHLYAGRTYFQAPEVDGVTYVNTALSGHELMIGRFVRARINDAMEYDLMGEIA